MKYSFCETLAAYKWHIRPLTKKGRKLTGGADTPTLCGLNASWDLQFPVGIDPSHVENCCIKCQAIYRALPEDQIDSFSV